MVKLFFLCRRRPDITHDRYAELLLGGHVPIALRHHPTMRRYVVNVVEETRPGARELDSIGQLSFASLDDYRRRLYDSPEGERIVHADVARFMGAADAYATTEHVQRDERPRAPLGTRTPGVKMICPLRRRPDLTHEAFVRHWLGTHAPLAKRHHPGLVGYVTNVVDARLSPEGEDWDGFAELYFRSAEDATTRMWDSPEGERIVRDDIGKFIGYTTPYRVAEWVARTED
jgi:uncharacterized protein (TIGR02118 family)